MLLGCCQSGLIKSHTRSPDDDGLWGIELSQML